MCLLSVFAVCESPRYFLILLTDTKSNTHSEHRFPAPFSRKDVVNRSLEFDSNTDYSCRLTRTYSGTVGTLICIKVTSWVMAN